MKLTVEEAISYIRQSVRWRYFSMRACSGCNAPSWGQPCITCGFYPQMSMTKMAYRAYKERIHKYTREEWSQKPGDMLDLFIQDKKNCVAWQQVHGTPHGHYQHPSEDSIKFVRTFKLWMEEAKKHTWPTREEMWDYMQKEEK